MRAMDVLKDIANTIYDCVQFTTDCPSNNKSKKIPCLDLKVYVKEDQIIHEFYEKPCAAKQVTPYQSGRAGTGAGREGGEEEQSWKRRMKKFKNVLLCNRVFFP